VYFAPKIHKNPLFSAEERKYSKMTGKQEAKLRAFSQKFTLCTLSVRRLDFQNLQFGFQNL